MGVFFDSLLILSLTLWILKLATQGSIDIQLAVVLIVALVALIGLGRAMGAGLFRLIFRVGLPLVSLATFLIWAGDGDTQQMASIGTMLFLILLMLVGIYIMFRGLFGWKQRKKD